MSVFATGDTHHDFRRLHEAQCGPHTFGPQEGDYLIICGDFGGVWDGGEQDKRDLNRLAELPYTILWVDGNHENYDLLAEYPVREWHGGKVQEIRPNVLHLMRGQVFDIEGHRFFTMGGASSHDVCDGILDPDAPDFIAEFKRLYAKNALFRVNHLSWWEQELPSEEEYAEARRNLDANDWKVDYIVTHCAPTSIHRQLVGDEGDELTDFLEEVRKKTDCAYWLFGHYHGNGAIDHNHVLLYEQVVELE